MDWLADIPVDPKLLAQMECCPGCATIRSTKPFMSRVEERDYTVQEQALLHAIFHETQEQFWQRCQE